ncbi:DNA cytosine methyltransferase [Bilophila wadsworthia]|uniref:DNA cytosine methyltransferase n=1 Tax=Bilophila wadsworthia TaxID=35833 RepID=UPI00351F9587
MIYLSVCSGIEAATVAWGPLGFQAVAFSEIEPFPSAVLAHHYPDVPNIGDMSSIDGHTYRGKVDILVGGTPCQSFSVAGLRRGLSDERGNLALKFVELADAIQPSFVLWENVPGVLSSKDNAFGCFIGGLCSFNGPVFPPGEGRWSSTGCVFGPQRTVAWRVLDAQYFGVPQRRRRLFVVACPRNGADPLSILFEFDGVRRDTPPRRETGQDVTQAVTRSLGAGGADDTRAQGGFYIPAIVGQAMSCKWSKGTFGPAGDEYHNLVCSPITIKPYANNAAQERNGSAYTMDTKDPQAIAIHMAQTSGQAVFVDVAPTVGASGPPYSRTGNSRVESEALALSGNCVRRLTPRECERLQGFPDGYTLIPGASDSARYKALGNSMAVPVMRWIGERIQKWENMYAD